MVDDYYALLGILKNASPEIIKRAYHEKARKYHPDVNRSDAANEFFLAIQEAYETLGDPEKRAAYDNKLDNSDFNVPLIRYKIIPSRNEISRLKEDQLIYALLEIECLKQSEEITGPQAHICLVIDQSTSMKGKRIEMVKANVTRLLKNLNGRDLISIVIFSDDAQILLPPTRISDSVLIESKISLIAPFGGTEIKKGLKTGIELLWQGKEESFAKYLVLLTDGQTYGDENICYDLAKKADKQGIIISALGIGNDWNDQFLEKLTSITGGTSSLVNSNADLDNYLKLILESLDIVYARRMCLLLENDPRFELKSMFQLDPHIIQFSNLAQQISIGDLLIKKKSIYLMEFLIHPLINRDKNVELIRGYINMELPREDQKKARLFPELTIPVGDKSEHDAPPTEIIKALSRLNFYMMQERTREDVKIGNYVNASRRLNYLATHLISAGEVQLANMVLSESESIQHTHHFTLTGEKDLKYGTKKLLGLLNP